MYRRTSKLDALHPICLNLDAFNVAATSTNSTTHHLTNQPKNNPFKQQTHLPTNQRKNKQNQLTKQKNKLENQPTNQATNQQSWFTQLQPTKEKPYTASAAKVRLLTAEWYKESERRPGSGRETVLDCFSWCALLHLLASFFSKLTLCFFRFLMSFWFLWWTFIFFNMMIFHDDLSMRCVLPKKTSYSLG